MMKRSAILLAFVFAAVSSVSAVDLPLTVSLAVTPAHALPGAPPSLTVTLVNTSSEPVLMPAIAIEISKAGEAPFVPFWHRPSKQYVASYESYQISPEEMEAGPTIPPGGSREIIFAAGLAQPGWFCDSRLSEPGTFELRVFVSPDFALDSFLLAPIQTQSDVFAMAGSNAVTFTVDVPQGDDAAAWSLKDSLVGKTCGWPNSVAQKIWERYPNSHYAAYNPPEYSGESKTAEAVRLQEAIDKDPNGFMADRLRLLLAGIHDDLVTSAMGSRERDLPKAIAENEIYSALLQQLSSSSNPEVRWEALMQLEEVASAEDLTAAFSKLTGQSTPLQPVEPIVECVTRHRINRKPVQARFGYNNPNASSVTLAFGEKNAFTPDPQDQGQPTTFLPGEHASAFTITAAKGTYLPSELRWNLDGGRAGLPAAAPDCAP